MFSTNPPRHKKQRTKAVLHAAMPLALLGRPEFPDGWSPDTLTTIMLAGIALLLTIILIHIVRLRLRLKKTASALEQRNKQFDCLGNDVPNIVPFELIYRSDRTFKFTFMGAGYQRLLGLDRDALLNNARQGLDHIYEKDVTLLKKAFQQGKKKGKRADFELRVLDINGKLKRLQVCATPRLEQRTLYWDGFFQDITSDHQARSALLDENKNLKNFFQVIGDFLFVCDMDGKLLHANPAAEARLDYPLNELLNMSVFELFPDDHLDGVYELIAQLHTNKIATSELPLASRTNEHILSEVRAFQGRWSQTEAVYLQIWDISTRRETETALRESEEVLQLIINSIPMSVYWKDTQSTYHGCNKAFVRECGLENINEIIGKTLHDLVDDDLAREIEAYEQRAIKKNHSLSHILKSYTRTDGSPGRREISLLPLQGNTGMPIGILGLWRDVTENSMAEERLTKMLEDLERFNDLLRSRERRTLELKAEVNELLNQSGKEHKYKTTRETRS